VRRPSHLSTTLLRETPGGCFLQTALYQPR